VSTPVTVTWLSPPPAPPAPTVTAVILSSGPSSGGTLVAIIGTNFTGGATVHFGANQANVLLVTPGLLIASSPAGSAGAVNVTVTTTGGTSAISRADQFTYVSGGIGIFPLPF
jgi:hypothetical protein